jgi:hypothetical protein
MKPIAIDIPHQLGKAEARRRIDAGFAGMQQRLFGASAIRRAQTWSGDTMTFEAVGLGQKARGRIEAMETAVRMEIDLPDWLAAIADTVRGRAVRETRLLLEKK